MVNEDKSSLELISTITEFNDLHEFMKDEHLDRALAVVIRLLMNQDVPSAKVPYLIVELQAMSAKFAILASVYSTILKDKAGTENNNKKNIYYTISSALGELAAALKYIVRSHT